MKTRIYQIVCVLMIGGLLAGVIAPVLLSLQFQTPNNEQNQNTDIEETAS